MTWSVVADLRFNQYLYVSEGAHVRVFERARASAAGAGWREARDALRRDCALGEGRHKKSVRRIAHALNVQAGRDWLLTCSFDGAANLYTRVADAADARAWAWEARFEGHGTEMKAVAILRTPRRPVVAACCRDRSVWFFAYDGAGQFTCLDVLDHHAQDVKFVAFHPSLPLLVSTSYDESVILYAPADASSGENWQLVARFQDHAATVWMAAFDLAGARLYTVGADGRLLTYESESLQRRRAALHKLRRNLFLAPIKDTSPPTDWRLVEQFNVAALEPTLPSCLTPNIYSVDAKFGQLLLTSSLGDIFVRNAAGEWTKIPDAHNKCEVNCAVWLSPDSFVSVADDDAPRLWTCAAPPLDHEVDDST